ncbi:MAG: hypothetical protein MJY56_04485 [Bacteroidales bacterium]|nr:hypothetical protein [Bacteroidales bacterium]
MRRIVFVLALMLVGIGAFGQEIEPGMMDVVKGKLCLDGVELSSSEVMNLVGTDIYYDTYEDAAKQYKEGRGLIISGCAFAGAGLVLTIVGASCLSDVCLGVGMGFCAGADVLLAGGCPLYCIGKGRLEWTAKQYNKSVRPRDVELAPASQGIGLALRF